MRVVTKNTAKNMIAFDARGRDCARTLDLVNNRGKRRRWSIQRAHPVLTLDGADGGFMQLKWLHGEALADQSEQQRKM